MSPDVVSHQNFDCIVVGGGPAGLTAAIALAEAGASVALVARRMPYGDNRTTALLGGSLDLLERLKVWPHCAEQAAALRTMRLVDDTGRLIRAPEVTFTCEEIGLDAFGYNIENRNLVAALETRSAEMTAIVRFDDQAEAVSPGPDAVEIRTAGGATLVAPLAVGADGRRSLCRDAAGIRMAQRPLGQAAVTFNITHSRPHRNISTEFHTAYGPCVFVPLPGQRSSIVWVSTADRAAGLLDMSDEELARATERQAHSLLGRVTVEPGRHRFPLTIERPDRFAAQRIALVGEAAHVIPPIGAQGLNLGLRDAADLAAIVGDVLAQGGDPGGPAALLRYEAARRADIASRTWMVDLANRTLLGDFLPVQMVRAFGMHLLAHVGPLRRIAMREGLQPSWRMDARR